MHLPKDVQRHIASFLTRRVVRAVFRGTALDTMFLTITLSKCVWKLCFR